MGRRPVSTKGVEKRPKNWVPEDRQAYLDGLDKIYSNDKAFLEKIGWEYENPEFCVENTIDIDTTKVHSKVWNTTAARGLKGKDRPVLRRCEEKKIPGGSAFQGIWPGKDFE